jgi:hypothetical protein
MNYRTAASVLATGAPTAASVVATGAVTAASVLATGAPTAASVVATGAATTSSVLATGAATAASVLATASDDKKQIREWEEKFGRNVADTANEDGFLFDLELEEDEEVYLKEVEEQNIGEAVVELSEAADSVLELHCAFSRSLYHTCLWLELEISSDYNTSYQPEHLGWRALESVVHDAREKQMFGVKKEMAKEEGVDELQDRDIGLSRCYYECRKTDGCLFFVYAEEMMSCIQLGKFDLEEMHQSCGFIMNGMMQGGEIHLGVSLIHDSCHSYKKSLLTPHSTLAATTDVCHRRVEPKRLFDPVLCLHGPRCLGE